MKLVEQHIVKKADKLYKELDHLCFLSKNLYNAALYEVRQQFFKDKTFLDYYGLNRLLHDRHDENYFALPSNTSQEVLKLVYYNYKSFFQSLKKKSGKKVRIPSYLDKEKGRFVLTYNSMTLSKNFLKIGIIRLPKTNLEFNSKHTNDLKQVRVIPKGDYLIIEVVYEVEEQELKEQNGNWLSIDLGVNNLATCTSNRVNAFIIDGKPLKSINQFYNKQLAHYKSKLEQNKQKSSNKVKALSLKRNNKVKDYLHKASRVIVNQAVEHSLTTIIVGYNKGWKQDTSMSKKSNQNFVQIPF